MCVAHRRGYSIPFACLLLQKAAELQARLEQLTSDADALRDELADKQSQLTRMQRQVSAAEAKVAEIVSKIEMVWPTICILM